MGVEVHRSLPCPVEPGGRKDAGTVMAPEVDQD